MRKINGVFLLIMAVGLVLVSCGPSPNKIHYFSYGGETYFYEKDAKVYWTLPEEYQQGEIILKSEEKAYVSDKYPQIALWHDKSDNNYRVYVVEELRNAENSSPQEMELEYSVLQQKIKENAPSEQELMDEYAKLFESIAKGDKTKASEYATLLRKITADECVFADEEVFEVAESYATVFSKMADGYDDFGLQDIVVSKGLDGKYTVGFEYCGEVRAYSVESVNNGEQVKVTFYDTKPSEVFLDKYSFGDEHQVEGFNLKLEYTADHGVVIYIRGAGLEIEEKASTTVGRPEGTIELEL